MKKIVMTAVCIVFVGCSSTKRTPWSAHVEQFYLHQQWEQNRKNKVEQGWDYEDNGWTEPNSQDSVKKAITNPSD